MVNVAARKVTARSPQPSSAEDLARQAAPFPAAWISKGSRSRPTTLSQDGRNVGGSRKAPSVGTWPHPRARACARVVLWIMDGACSREGASAPVDTRGCPAAPDRYRTKTGAAWGRSCLASRPSCEGVTTPALATNQCRKLFSWWNPDMFGGRSAS